MKKLIIAIAALFALGMVSCHGNTDGEQMTDSVPADTIQPVQDSVKQLTGVAVDGGMNSIVLEVGDQTYDFSYPDLEPEHRDSWEAGDTMTVRYYATENGDSVTAVIRGSVS